MNGIETLARWNGGKSASGCRHKKYQRSGVGSSGFALAVLLLVLCTAPASSQVGIPVAEPIYGGMIEWIDAVALDPATSRLFISTESANSMFWTDVDHSGGSPLFTAFTTIPDLDDDNGFGKEIRRFAADGNSGHVFALAGPMLLNASIVGGTLDTLETDFVLALHVYAGRLYYLKVDPSTGISLHFGTIAADGSFSESADSPLLVAATAPAGPMLALQVDPDNDALYIFESGAPPTIYKSSDAYDYLSTGTTFSSVPTSVLGSTPTYTAFGIGPDGRLFAGSVMNVEPNQGKFISYTDDDGLHWTPINTGIGGTSGHSISCGGSSAASYHVYFGTAYSSNRGEAGSWERIGWAGRETHPNDGAVVVDPNDYATIYATTDQGIGTSNDRGQTLYEIDDGVEAVQVNDFSMDGSKNTAWVASKAGVWRVADYQTSPTWSGPFYPFDDGSPFHSVALDTTDHTGSTVYVGNTRVYGNDGSGWQLLRSEDPSFSFWTTVNAIAVDPFTTPHRVVIGYFDAEETTKGGIFVTKDGGLSWYEVSGGDLPSNGADVHDLVVVEEDGAPVIYAGVDYHYDASYGTARSIYRIEGDAASGWTVTQDMKNTTQNISANIMDLAVDSTGGIWACGADVGTNHPVVYHKAHGDSVWDVVTASISGLPSGTPARSVTVDESTGDVYIAVDNEIYRLRSGASAWALYYAYPVGTDINFVYFDDLLVGTGTGLYEHRPFVETTVAPGPAEGVPSSFVLEAAYPNPFSALDGRGTKIRFTTPEDMSARLRVFDVLGREVAVLFDGAMQANQPKEVRFLGEGLASGIYFYRLETPGETITRSLVLLK